MRDEDDTAGRLIPPNDLPRIMGVKFVSVSQLRDHMNTHKEHAEAMIDVLVENGMFVQWAAARCPNCSFIWPHHKADDKDGVGLKVFCPICNKTSPVEYVDFYNVYEVKRWME